VTSDEREILESAVQRVTEQAANADPIMDEAMDAGIDGSEPFVVNLKMPRAELLSVKGDLERELEKVQLGLCRLRGARSLRRRSRRAGGPLVARGHTGARRDAEARTVIGN
jgi:hypothetical protein